MIPQLPPGLTVDQVRRYLDNRTKEFGSLGEAVAARNAPLLRGLAHKIKGNAALYGMPEFGIVAGNLVDAVEAGDWAEISSKVDSLIRRLAEERHRFSDQ